MSYCLNPSCRRPENLTSNQQCHFCGSQLSKLRDRYCVTKALAQGGFGATFLAQDQGLPGEPICVIKQLRPPTNTPAILQMARELFAREARTLGKIGNHPQVPRLLDYFEDNQQFYLVQEYINGCTLQQEIKRSGPVSEVGAKQFLSEILAILQYIHERQVIHRDIKPANLIRRAEDGKLVLIDFGAVKNQVNQTQSNQPEPTTLTAYSIGTTGFAPPEQIAMRPVYASDIYAVGVTCIYLLTGKSPKEIDYNPLTGEMLWEAKVQVSKHLTAVLKKMLEASVRHRYQSAKEVLNALELEPYLDSMAKGMAAQPTTTRVGSNQTQTVSSGSKSPSVASVAEAIRARRDKSAAVSLQPGSVRHPVGTSQPTAVGTAKTNISKQKLKAAQFDTDSLLNAYVNGRRDFALQELSSLNLQRKDLSGINFHASKLTKANLQGANLCNSDFGQASLNQANLRDANLSKAYMSHADLAGADMRGADLSYAYLNHANLRGANLCGANLTGVKVTDEQLAQAKTNWLTVRPNGKRGLL
ncbi:serine/threonine-protein kinase [Chroococcidiopsis sp. CCMEE 29]|uniref:serine/threonine-protein kinase n=1 Tax=Chroococcidiopsis sp. CCMEE 29 TaxID=155894 RepID=UPI00202112AE|nr:serine/threonine-protein kinase [Chroococcidiopsis sp. CCMEE 29]